MRINFKIFLGFLGGSMLLILVLGAVLYNDLIGILTNQGAIDQAQVIDRVNILFAKTILLVLLILILFVIGMMWFFRRVIIEPIEKMRQGTERIKKGDLDYKMDLGDKNDEIGELANEFNSMAGVLKKYKHTMEQKVAERTADLEKFKMAVDNAFDCVYIADPEGAIIYANKSTERVTGFMRREVMGHKIGSNELWSGQMSKEFYDNMWNKLKEEKQSFLGEVKNKRKSGDQYNALLSISPILDKNHKILFFVSIERDITSVTKGSY